MTKYIIIGFIFLIACTSNTQPTTVKKIFYPNGMLKAEGALLNDTIEDGLIKYYDTLGRLYLETSYKNGIKEGAEKGYFKNGSVEYVAKFKEGKQDSVTTWYCQDGKIDLRQNWIDGGKIGTGLRFYPNQILQQYNFYDFEGQLVYKRKYSENGDVIGEEGYPMLVQILSDEPKIRDTLKLKIYVATPVGCEMYLFFGIENKVNWQSIPISSNVGTYNYVFKTKGVYNWKIKLHVKDNQKNTERDEYESVQVNIK